MVRPTGCPFHRLSKNKVSRRRFYLDLDTAAMTVEFLIFRKKKSAKIVPSFPANLIDLIFMSYHQKIKIFLFFSHFQVYTAVYD
jgi:hypothetical protein